MCVHAHPHTHGCAAPVCRQVHAHVDECMCVCIHGHVCICTCMFVFAYAHVSVCVHLVWGSWKDMKLDNEVRR